MALKQSTISDDFFVPIVTMQIENSDIFSNSDGMYGCLLPSALSLSQLVPVAPPALGISLLESPRRPPSPAIACSVAIGERPLPHEISTTCRQADYALARTSIFSETTTSPGLTTAGSEDWRALFPAVANDRPTTDDDDGCWFDRSFVWPRFSTVPDKDAADGVMVPAFLEASGGGGNGVGVAGAARDFFLSAHGGAGPPHAEPLAAVEPAAMAPGAPRAFAPAPLPHGDQPQSPTPRPPAVRVAVGGSKGIEKARGVRTLQPAVIAVIAVDRNMFSSLHRVPMNTRRLRSAMSNTPAEPGALTMALGWPPRSVSELVALLERLRARELLQHLRVVSKSRQDPSAVARLFENWRCKGIPAPDAMFGAYYRYVMDTTRKKLCLKHNGRGRSTGHGRGCDYAAKGPNFHCRYDHICLFCGAPDHGWFDEGCCKRYMELQREMMELGVTDSVAKVLLDVWEQKDQSPFGVPSLCMIRS